jgi:ribosomal protein S18 acetylase RimI-like enzyme
MFSFTAEKTITVDQFRDILVRSTLGKRRPLDDITRLEAMLQNANLVVTCWMEDELVGIARSVTDFHYCCYVSDLAVDVACQRQGIGKQLIAETRSHLHPACTLILLSAPAATEYYGKIGFSRHPQAFVFSPGSASKE